LRLPWRWGAVCPWYQPIVDLKTQQVIAFEALGPLVPSDAWRHTARSFHPNCRRLRAHSAVERLSASPRLARMRLAWPDKRDVSFNISPIQLRGKIVGTAHPGHSRRNRFGASAPRNRDHRERHRAGHRGSEGGSQLVAGTPGSALLLMISETGYSSLYHLRSFKFDAIKIDRSFVGNMASEEESAAIVHALTGLGHGLGLVITRRRHRAVRPARSSAQAGMRPRSRIYVQ